MASTPHGALTDDIADELRRLASCRQTWCVYHDHDGERRERLWAHMGDEPCTTSNLSGLDMLLGDAESGRAVLVLEIEETACRPKGYINAPLDATGGACLVADSIPYNIKGWVALGPRARNHCKRRHIAIRVWRPR